MTDHAETASPAPAAAVATPTPTPTATAAAPAPQQASASALPEGVTDPNYQPLPGRLGNLTVPQQHALEKLKKELQEEGVFVPERMDDAMLLRCVCVLREKKSYQVGRDLTERTFFFPPSFSFS